MENWKENANSSGLPSIFLCFSFPYLPNVLYYKYTHAALLKEKEEDQNVLLHQQQPCMPLILQSEPRLGTLEGHGEGEGQAGATGSAGVT